MWTPNYGMKTIVLPTTPATASVCMGCTANRIPETQGVYWCRVMMWTQRVNAAVVAACNKVLNTWKPRADRPPARATLRRKERTASGRYEPWDPLCSSGVPQKSWCKRSHNGVWGKTSSFERIARLKSINRSYVIIPKLTFLFVIENYISKPLRYKTLCPLFFTMVTIILSTFFIHCYSEKLHHLGHIASRIFWVYTRRLCMSIV